jgi:TolB-like protein
MKRFALIALFFTALSVYGQANRSIPLDSAIEEAAKDMDMRITAKSKIALISFNAPSALFSDYVLDELTANLVNSGHLIVVDRKEIDLIRGELNFQYSGDVDDNSMQELGRVLGAQSIVSGSLTDIGGVYRIVIRVLNVQTAAVEVQYRTNIVNDNKVRALLGETVAKPPRKPLFGGGAEKPPKPPKPPKPEKPPKPPREPSTIAGKIGTGALNIVLGLGSYIEGDIAGGLTLTAGYAVAAGLVVIEVTALDWDSPMVGVPITAGVSLAGLTLVYGFVRPFIYNRSPQTAYILDNTQSGMVTVPDRFGNDALALRLTYSIKF